MICFVFICSITNFIYKLKSLIKLFQMCDFRKNITVKFVFQCLGRLASFVIEVDSMVACWFQLQPLILWNTLRLLQTRASSFDSILQFIDSLSDSRHADELELSPVSYSEVLKSLASMRLDCSTGADQIPAKYLKLSAEYISSPLTHIINCFISSHSFPKAWKNARIWPIPKVDSPVEADDYRPIAVLHVFQRFMKDSR